MSAWISVAQIKARRGDKDPNGTHGDDALLGLVAQEACDYVEQLTGRHLVEATYTRIFNGNGRTFLALPVIPATNVAALTIGTNPITLGTADQFRTGMVSAYWTATQIVYPGRYPVGYANVKATWTAGYKQDKIPGGIISATIGIAMLMYKERDRYGDNTKNLPGQTVNYIRELAGADKRALETMIDWRGLYVDDPGVDV